MRTGIIIIFHNNEKEIDTTYFINQIKQTSNLELCLVNNDSKDDTYKLLKEVKDACKNVSVVDIKKFKSNTSAIRSGARFMFNRFDLKHLGYVSANSLKIKHYGLIALIKVIVENQELIVNYNVKSLKKKQTLFQSLFSVIDYLKNIKISSQFIQVQL